MSNERQPPIGIDLGTTFTVIARLTDAGKPETLPNAEGELLTPSVVLFDGQDVIVGKEAAKAMTSDLVHVADCPKRQVGARVYNKVIDGRRYPPEALEAWILRKAAQDAQTQAGPIREVVITVPAYFDESRRKATQDAGYIAGLDVVDIINEPTAAAIAFGYRSGLLDLRGEAARPQRMLVYDLGGGTFDVTVMEVERDQFRTIATDGDIQLGGNDWDRRLVDFVAEQFIRNFGNDPRADPDALGQLLRDCREAKETLSSRTSAVVSCSLQGMKVKKTIGREKFEELTGDLLERTAFTTRQTLKSAGLKWEQIDLVLLAGGSTRMPAVRNMLEQISGRPAQASVSPDEAVAHGAAIRAGILQGRHPHGHAGALKIQNVNSHSLGVVANDVKTGQAQVVTIIPRNTPLPVIGKRVFRTHRPAQESILVQVVEGESKSPEDCSPIGKCSIWNLPEKMPVDTPIEVRFGYRDDGRLRVEVHIAGAAHPFRYKIDRPNSLTQEQLDSWRSYIGGDQAKPPESAV